MRRALAYLAAAVVVLSNAPLWVPLRVVQRVDEGYIAAFAWRMAEGHMLPFVDAVSNRGPMVYWPPALFALALGGGTPLAIRACALAFMLATCALTYASGAVMGRARAGAAAALAYAAMSAAEPSFLPYNGEHVINACTLASFVCAALGLRRKTTSLCALAGALASLAFLSKLVGLLAVGVMGAWVLTRRDRRLAVAYALGALAPVLACALLYARVHALADFHYFFYAYNSRVYMAPITGARALANLAGFVVSGAAWLAPLVVLVVLAVLRALRRRAWTGETSIALLALGSVVAAKTPLRDFSNYFVQVLPWFGLLVALRAEVFVRGARPFVRRASVVALAASLAALLIIAARSAMAERALTASTYGPGLPWTDPLRDGLCASISARSGTSDTIFVWGFQPWIYVACGRKPASRYVFTTFLMGYVPWFDEPEERERERITPGSHAILAAELEAAKPAIIVDAPIGWRSMRAYPDLAPLLGGYCLVEHIGGRDVYARCP